MTIERAQLCAAEDLGQEMRRTIATRSVALGLGLSLWAGVSAAQIELSPEDVLNPGPRDEAVQKVQSGRIQGDVLYLDPDAPFQPDESIRIKLPDPPDDPAAESEMNRWITGLFYGAILVGIIALIIFQGGRIQVNFNRTGDRQRNGASDASGGAAGETILPEEGFLDRLAAMADRREALILLTGRALERAATANNMTLARAQTARDVVRAVPRAWQHRDVLSNLVRQAEIVHFGGRDLSEAAWQDCLAAARPMFGRVSA